PYGSLPRCCFVCRPPFCDVASAIAPEAVGREQALPPPRLVPVAWQARPFGAFGAYLLAAFAFKGSDSLQYAGRSALSLRVPTSRRARSVRLLCPPAGSTGFAQGIGVEQFGWTEHVLESLLEGKVEVSHRHWKAEVDKTGDAVICDAARHDSAKVRQVGFDIDGNAVEAHPAPEPDADGGDLVLRRRAVCHGRPIRPDNPAAAPVFAPFAAYIESGQCGDEPILERGDEGPHILASPFPVQHDVSDPLAGTMIGIFTAPSGGEHGEAVRIDQILLPSRSAGRVEWRMFHKPHELAVATFPDRGSAGFHDG